MVLFQNVSEGPPNSVLQVAVKNSQQPVWYFSDKIPLQTLFVEDGRMERGTFLEVLFSLDTCGVRFWMIASARACSLYFPILVFLIL